MSFQSLIQALMEGIRARLNYMKQIYADLGVFMLRHMLACFNDNVLDVIFK